MLKSYADYSSKNKCAFAFKGEIKLLTRSLLDCGKIMVNNPFMEHIAF